MIIFTWLSIQIYDYNKSKDSQNEAFQKTIEKPILILRIAVDVNGAEFWEVSNIGRGAAMNLRIGHSLTRSIKWEEPVLKCYSLGSGESLPLNWLFTADAICVTYKDVFENLYVTITADNESHFRLIDSNFTNIIVDGYAFKKEEFDGFLNLSTNRITVNNLTNKLSVTLQTTSP